jgi:hypothetical protein
MQMVNIDVEPKPANKNIDLWDVLSDKVKSKYYEKKRLYQEHNLLHFGEDFGCSWCDVLALPSNVCNDYTFVSDYCIKIQRKNLKMLEFPLIQDEQENIIATLL